MPSPYSVSIFERQISPLSDDVSRLKRAYLLSKFVEDFLIPPVVKQLPSTGNLNSPDVNKKQQTLYTGNKKSDKDSQQSRKQNRRKRNEGNNSDDKNRTKKSGARKDTPGSNILKDGSGIKSGTPLTPEHVQRRRIGESEDSAESVGSSACDGDEDLSSSLSEDEIYGNHVHAQGEGEGGASFADNLLPVDEQDTIKYQQNTVEDDDDDIDEIIVFKPSFNKPSWKSHTDLSSNKYSGNYLHSLEEDQVEGKMNEGVDEIGGDMLDEDSLSFLRSVHDRNMQLSCNASVDVGTANINGNRPNFELWGYELAPSNALWSSGSGDAVGGPLGRGQWPNEQSVGAPPPGFAPLMDSSNQSFLSDRANSFFAGPDEAGLQNSLWSGSSILMASNPLTNSSLFSGGGDSSNLARSRNAKNVLDALQMDLRCEDNDQLKYKYSGSDWMFSNDNK